MYVLGTFVVMRAFNAPRNDTLATVKPTDPDAAIHWARYVSGWTAWNHVRTVAALSATAACGTALGR